MMNATAIIVAAGEGRRIGGDTPKIFLPLCGRAMILRTLDQFFSASKISRIVLVVGAEQLSHAAAMLQADAATRDRPWVLQTGGATRQESVRRGLEKAGADSDIIAIHDGARPFVSSALIDRGVEAAHDKGAVAVGLPARDTIKIVAADRWIEATPPRDSLWEIQTPQVFRREIIADAHAWAARENVEGTDDAVLVEKKGGRVFLLDGERTNFKITLPDDIWLAESLIRAGRIP
jgi:2-C-methyl-D-erythritol 4-phosphate cytidylyltransferase